MRRALIGASWSRCDGERLLSQSVASPLRNCEIGGEMSQLRMRFSWWLQGKKN
jgi:hypothetical protein